MTADSNKRSMGIVLIGGFSFVFFGVFFYQNLLFSVLQPHVKQEKDRLRKQMEARVAAMRAGLKRRLQEARAERAGRSKDVDERDSRTD